MILENDSRYLRVIKGGNRHANAVLGYEIPIRASIYHELAPIAARQGLSVSVFVARLCEAVIEMEPRAGEVQADG